MLKRRVFFILGLLCALLVCAECGWRNNVAERQKDQQNNLIEETKYFEITDKSTAGAQLYEYVIYTKDGRVACKEEVGRQPCIELLPGGLLEIQTSHGSNAQLYRYYDINKDLFSGESFWNRSLVCEDGKVIYMSLDEKNKTVLIIQDIFDKEKYYREVHRDFAPFAVPSMALEAVKILENGDLEIMYCSTNAQKLEKEIIPLGSATMD